MSRAFRWLPRYRLQTLLGAVLVAAVAVTVHVRFREQAIQQRLSQILNCATPEAMVAALADELCRGRATSRLVAELLPRLVTGGDEEARRRASLGLQAVAPATARHLVPWLPDPTYGNVVALELARMTAYVRPQLEVFLHPAQPAELRRRAAFVLLQSAAFGQNQKPEAALLAQVLLSDPDKEVRFLAANGLELMGLDAADYATSLVSAIADPDHRVACKAIRALARVAPDSFGSVAPHARYFLQSEQAAVRSDAIGAISFHGMAAAAIIPDLLAQLDDRDRQVRRAAAGALGSIGARGDDAISALIALLGDEEPLVVAAATYSLSLLTPESCKAEDALANLLDHENDFVRQEAAWALDRLRERRDDEA